MNEPSVFSGEELTMSKSATHFLADGTPVIHRDVHNAYGHMMTKSTYTGLYERDEPEPLRPFVLTRSSFYGTQRYAAKWTGDNKATMQELPVSIN